MYIYINRHMCMWVCLCLRVCMWLFIDWLVVSLSLQYFDEINVFFCVRSFVSSIGEWTETAHVHWRTPPHARWLLCLWRPREWHVVERAWRRWPAWSGHGGKRPLIIEACNTPGVRARASSQTRREAPPSPLPHLLFFVFSSSSSFYSHNY